MRGRIRKQEPMFVALNVDSLVESRLAMDHPLRRIRLFARGVLASLDTEFEKFYSHTGRPSVPPEQMLMALLWQALFSIRSERMLEDVIRYDLRCRWFIGLPLDQDAWNHSTFSKAREAFLLQPLAYLFFERHVAFMRAENLVSSDHLSVDGTLMSAWASHKSLVKKDDLDDDGNPPPRPPGGRNAWVDFKGEKRSNATHVSATDPDSKLASKGGEAKLSFELNVLAENRNNLAVDFTVCPPTGTSEREEAATLVAVQAMQGHTPKTVGADRKYAEGDKLVEQFYKADIEPHFSVRDDRPNALARLFHDTTGYSISQRCRMRIEEIFAYAKTIGGLAKLKVRGLSGVFGVASIVLAAYNLRRHASLQPG